MTRCLWCNGSEGELRTVTLIEGRARRPVAVHSAPEASLAAWHARVASDTPRFVATMAFAPLILLAAIGLAALVSRTLTSVVLGLALVALAAFVWRHPYATPLTVRLLGVRRSVRLVRAAAVVLAIGGFAAAVAGLRGAV